MVKTGISDWLADIVLSERPHRGRQSRGRIMDYILSAAQRGYVATYREGLTKAENAKASLVASIDAVAIQARKDGISVSLIAPNGDKVGHLAGHGGSAGKPASTDSSAVVADILATLESGNSVTLDSVRAAIARHYVPGTPAVPATSVSATIRKA